MVPVSELAKEALNNPAARRKIRIRVEADRTITFTDEDTIDFQFTEQCSGDYDLILGGVFSVGCIAVLSNSTGKLAGTQFQGARIIPEEDVEIAPDTYEPIPLGEYEVHEVKYKNDTVELSARNNLQRLDRPLSDVNLVYPITLKNAMTLICQRCGVVFSNTEFLNQNHTIEKVPEGEMSCRDAVSYIAELAGSFVRCDRQGRLEFAGFEDTAPVFGETILDGNTDSVDGGDFTSRPAPVYDGGKFIEKEPVISITSDIMYSQSYDGTPIVITGISFDAGDTSYLYGGTRYCIALSDNPFLTHDIEDVLEAIGRKLIGCSYVLTSVSWPGNPCSQAGDAVKISTRDGGAFRTIVTKSVYRYLKQCTLTSGGTAPSETQYQSEAQKMSSKIKAGLSQKQEQLNAVDLAARSLFALFTGVAGGYRIDGDELGGIHKGRMYLALDSHDIEVAQEVWVYSMAGIFHFKNGIYNEPSTAWGNDGSALFSLVTANMIRAGLLQSLNGESWINLDDGTFSFGNGSLVWDGTTFKVVSADKLTNADSDGTYGEVGAIQDGYGEHYGLSLKRPDNTEFFGAYDYNGTDPGFFITSGIPGNMVLWTNTFETTLIHPFGNANGFTATEYATGMVLEGGSTGVWLDSINGISFSRNWEPYGHTENVTISGVTFHITNGIITGVTRA